MNIKIFKGISGYGRLAYGIMCLESSIIFYDLPIKDWKWVIEKLWSYSSVTYYDEWCYEIAEYHPDILSEVYHDSDFDYISEEQFDRLCKIYQASNDVVLQLLKNIYELAAADLYSKVRNEGKNSTLFYLKNIIRLLESNQIELPHHEGLLKYKYDTKINSGFGERVGAEYSVILNSDPKSQHEGKY